MLLSAVMCAKPLRHRNVNIKLYINQIYVNTIIHKIKKQRKLYVSFIICLFFRPISALIIPTPLFLHFIPIQHPKLPSGDKSISD